jgi:ABC-type proline/glycine betaine transport system permease subunit
MDIPPLPLADWIDSALEVLTDQFSGATRAISNVIETGIDAMVNGLMWPPPWVVIGIFTLIAWRIAGFRVALFTVLGLGLLWDLQLWYPTTTTEDITVCVIFGFLCILTARAKYCRADCYFSKGARRLPVTGGKLLTDGRQSHRKTLGAELSAGLS